MAGYEPDPSDMTDDYATAGSNQSGMRARNERLVLSLLRRLGPQPKAEIARKTGLSAQTVSVIMRALESDGLLEKGEKVRGKVGQPSVPLRLAPEGAYFLGMKVGRRSAELILVNFIGEELAHVTETYAYPTPDMALRFARQAVAEVCAALPPERRRRIAGMGIASPFFLWEWAAMIGVDPAKMDAWRDFDLCAEMGALFDFPVFLGNDATSACGAELTFGTGSPPPDFLYVYIGYFVGGGIALNGSLYAGRSGNAGAIGPFLVTTPSGAQKQLIDAASVIGLERRVAARCGDANAMMTGQGAWEIDDEAVEDWLAEAVPALAQLIVGAGSIMDFPAVLIDGNMPAALRETIIERVIKALEEMPSTGVMTPEIRAGTLGPRARPLGAASLPLSKRFMLED
ncbi:MAG: ROK family transcriptional regulator [Pseudomonadota bacterium]